MKWTFFIFLSLAILSIVAAQQTRYTNCELYGTCEEITVINNINQTINQTINNGTGSANFTNVAFTNESNTFTENNTFEQSILLGGRLVLTDADPDEYIFLTLGSLLSTATIATQGNFSSSGGYLCDASDCYLISDLNESGGGNFNGEDFQAAFNSNFSAKDTDDLSEGSTNFYDNRSWNQSLAASLFYSISNPSNFINQTENIFDQSLNTTDNVRFAGLNVTGNIRQKSSTATGMITLADRGSSEALILWGTQTDEDAYMNMGAYQGRNNINTKSRNLRIFSSSVSNIFEIIAATGEVTIANNTKITGDLNATYLIGDGHQITNLSVEDNDTQKDTQGPYLFNDTTTIFFNETKLNETIDQRDEDTQKNTGGQPLYNDSTTIYFNQTYNNNTIEQIIKDNPANFTNVAFTNETNNFTQVQTFAENISAEDFVNTNNIYITDDGTNWISSDYETIGFLGEFPVLKGKAAGGSQFFAIKNGLNIYGSNTASFNLVNGTGLPLVQFILQPSNNRVLIDEFWDLTPIAFDWREPNWFNATATFTVTPKIDTISTLDGSQSVNPNKHYHNESTDQGGIIPHDWNVTGRVLNTAYTNNKDRSVIQRITVLTQTSSGDTAFVRAFVGSTAVAATGWNPDSASSDEPAERYDHLTFSVKPGETFSVNTTVTGTGSVGLYKWVEDDF